LGALVGKTRILVTHQVHLLSQCDLVLVLDNGRIKAQGSIADLQQSGVDFTTFVTNASTNEHSQTEEDMDKKDPEEGPSIPCLIPYLPSSLSYLFLSLLRTIVLLLLLLSYAHGAN
jgi:ABC-type multidrug transport system ATPase subunit